MLRCLVLLHGTGNLYVDRSGHLASCQTRAVPQPHAPSRTTTFLKAALNLAHPPCANDYFFHTQDAIAAAAKTLAGEVWPAYLPCIIIIIKLPN
jgi:hypothetical protein